MVVARDEATEGALSVVRCVYWREYGAATGSRIRPVKRWDDLQLLKLIDELEESEPGTLIQGLTLMDRARPLADRDPQNDPRNLAHELLLARAAGLLEWKEWNTGQGYDPIQDPHLWLQQIGNFYLTIKGREKARGRVVITDLPDPDQDNGQMILGYTLEEIGRSIAEVCTAPQLPRLLYESGIPPEFLPPEVVGDSWEYCAKVMESLLDGGSAARRSLREFIGHWLSDQLQFSPRSVRARERVVELLARQGWHVQEGVLVVGPTSKADRAKLAPLYRESRTDRLHPEVRQVAERYLDGERPEVAIFEAFKAITLRVKKMTGLDADGEDLMNKAMSGESPLIRFSALRTETDRNVQAGFRFIFMGVVRAIRDPDAHEQFRKLSDEEAFEELGLASLLMRRLDGSERYRDRDQD